MGFEQIAYGGGQTEAVKKEEDVANKTKTAANEISTKAFNQGLIPSNYKTNWDKKANETADLFTRMSRCPFPFPIGRIWDLTDRDSIFIIN